MFGEPNLQAAKQSLSVKVKAEVASRLKQSLHYGIQEKPTPIALRMELQPNRVKRFWDEEISAQNKSAIQLPSEMSIMDVFNLNEVGGRLLVLGEPGAGKTTTMLEIAYQLLKISTKDNEFPIPVLFNLSSWKDSDQSIESWINNELKKYKLSGTANKNLIKEQKLAILLDGLDEVEPKLQPLCVEAINVFLEGKSSPAHVVICCRCLQYYNAGSLLSVNNAVYLKNPTRQQVKDYLYRVKRPDLWSSLKREPYSIDLICNPFLLNIALLFYPNTSTKKWQEISGSTNQYCQNLLEAYIQSLVRLSKTPYLLKMVILCWQQVPFKKLPELVLANARVNYLINSYVENALTPLKKDNAFYPREVPSSEQSRKWLVLIAKNLERELQYDFLIENMQPDWLHPNLGGSTAELRNYIVLCNLCYVAAMQFGPVLHAVVSTPNVYIKVGFLLVWRPLLVALPLFTGIILGSFLTLRPIRTVDIVDFPAFKVLVLLFLLLIIVPQSVLDTDGKITLVYFLSAPLFFNLQKAEEEKGKRKTPNEGIGKSAINAICFGSIYGFVIFVGLWSTYNFYPLGIIDAFFSALSQGIVVALITGGDTVIRHFSLRFSLARANRIPWKYRNFLDYATQHRILQKVGGRYRFFHSLIQEHLAQLKI